MTPDGLTPGPSLVAGTGLFTGQAIGSGGTVLDLALEPRTPEDLGHLNHSCDPNLGWSGPRTLVARRDIAAGDELTCDYATCIADPDFVLYCHCETYRCRQVVEGTDWKIPQLQARYAGCWTPTVQQLIDGAR